MSEARLPRFTITLSERELAVIKKALRFASGGFSDYAYYLECNELVARIIGYEIGIFPFKPLTKRRTIKS